jgi:hypothetical protein
MISDRQYVTRKVSEQADEAISKRFEGKPIVGPASPKQTWQRALFHIAALPFEYSASAYRLWQCALKNAELRGDDDIKKLERIQRKLFEEHADYIEAQVQYNKRVCKLDHVIYRMVNVVYYTVQEYAHTGDIQHFILEVQKICATAGLPVFLVLQCAEMKMWDRVTRGIQHQPADKEHEHLLIQQILSNWQNS